MEKILIWGMEDSIEDAVCIDDEFGIMLTKVRVPVPEPKLNYVEIPLSDTVIDFSEFSDVIHYNHSITRLTFAKSLTTRESWAELYFNLQSAIHGEEFHWCFSSDVSNVYTGRFILRDWLSSGTLGTLVVEVEQTRELIKMMSVRITANGGTGADESEWVEEGSTYTVPANTYTRTGYTYVKWNTAADHSGTYYEAGDEITITGDLTLYAIWGFTITYNANGGSGSMDQDIVVEGESIALDACTYTYGTYRYLRWNTSPNVTGMDYDPGETVTPTDNMTLYAVWASLISFNANGGTGSISPVLLIKGRSYTLDPTGFSRGDLTFRRWNTAADYSGTDYAATGSITPTGDITLYAVWGCTITYNANSGSGSMAAETYDYGTTHNLAEATYTMADYSFDGWNTAADGSGTDYADEASVTLTDNLTLYAKWAQAGDVYWDIDSSGNVSVKSDKKTELVGNVIIPSTVNGTTVTGIAALGLYQCTGMTAVTIPNSVTTIGDYAFGSCTGLTSADIPNSVRTFGSSIFYSCSNLSNVTLSNGLTTLGGSMFSNCTSLTSITIPNSVTALSEYLFSGCGFTSVTIPSHITSIGNGAYAYCTGLSSVTVSSGVSTIGASAFTGCSNLASISIPESVTSIGSYAFQACSSLASITLPSGITSIGLGIFYDCTGLASVTIPSSVTSIARIAFYNCRALANITLEATTPPTLQSNSLTNVPADATITVPYSADHSVLNAYKSASNWSARATYIVEASE